MKVNGLVLVLLSLLLIGCGKEVVEVEKGRVLTAQEMESKTFSIQYDHPTLKTFLKPIPRNATFKIPDIIEFNTDAGIILSQNLQIFFNMQDDHLTYEFRCIYRPNNSSQEFELVSCFNHDQQNLGSILGIDFMLDEGKSILIQTAEVNAFGAIIHLPVEWK